MRVKKKGDINTDGNESVKLKPSILFPWGLQSNPRVTKVFFCFSV